MNLIFIIIFPLFCHGNCSSKWYPLFSNQCYCNEFRNKSSLSSMVANVKKISQKQVDLFYDLHLVKSYYTLDYNAIKTKLANISEEHIYSKEEIDLLRSVAYHNYKAYRYPEKINNMLLRDNQTVSVVSCDFNNTVSIILYIVRLVILETAISL